jgi:RecB family exonuclease
MDPTDFVTPHPGPITDLSPSLANQLMGCQLRVAFSRDRDLQSWRRLSTYSALGLAAHAVTEAAFQRQDWLSDEGAIRFRLEELWDTEVARTDGHLRLAWAPAKPPSPADWPGYALTRVRTIRRATKLLSVSRSVRSDRTEGSGVEIELRDSPSGLFGRVDRIERDGDSVRVVDLKTGLHQDEPTDDQRRQLLLYSVLVHRTTGSWPSSIAVEDASGFQHVLPLDPEEAEAALCEVEVTVAAFNESVLRADFEENADPNPERCRWCAYRALCRPFWEALTSDWGQRAVLGTVLEAGMSEGGAFVLIAVESPTDQSGRVLHVSSLPEPLPVTATTAAIVDWSGSFETRAVRTRWSTIVRSW